MKASSLAQDQDTVGYAIPQKTMPPSPEHSISVSVLAT